MRYDRLLEGKIAWITGGAQPPYDAYARLFSAHGAKIVMIGGRAEDGEKLCGEIMRQSNERGDGCGGCGKGNSNGSGNGNGNGGGGGSDSGGNGCDVGSNGDGSSGGNVSGVINCDSNSGGSSNGGDSSGDGRGRGSAEFYECDLYDAARIEALCGKLLTASGVPDVFLHVADSYIPAYIDELDFGDLERMLAISITAPFAVMKCIAESMIAKNGGGSVVLVCGHYGVQGMNRVSGYGAAKGGEISLAYSLAMEYATGNIRVNAIAPGTSFPPVGDGLPALSGETDTPDFWGTVQPFRRRGRMDELANAALFLDSDMSMNITGEVLLVNGAQHLIAHNHNFPRRDRPLPFQEV